jgi:hypothetical protein
VKLLDYGNGYLNLKQTSFFEILIKQDSKDIYSCWLECHGRDIFIFSFAEEKDARNFRNYFWSKVKGFVLNDEEKVLNLMGIIHEIVPEFFKENK